MNFYKHFLGDYARDTAHLAMLEHGAYRLMLDHYYATGKGLPADKALLYRICKASSKAERAAVDLVAEAYFPVNGDGTRHNKRADREIAETNAYAEAQSTRAHKRWDKQKDMPPQMQVHHQTQCPIDASHSHSQIKPKSKTLSGKPDDAIEVLKFLNLKANRSYRPVKAHCEMIQARLAEGFTVAELKQVTAKKCREWLTDDKMAEYLRPKTLFSRTNFANYAGELVDAAEQT